MRGREPLVVFSLFGVVAVEIVVTYSRLPAEELYHVSGSGLDGGLGRAVVFLNFPVALVALAVIALVFERLAGRGTRVLAVVAAILCLPVFWPGVVRQSNLDVRWINVPAAIGVEVAFLLALAACRGGTRRPVRGDRVRLMLAVLALLAAPAWLAADLGFFLNGVPLLGRVYETGPFYVHHGHHHGMDGVLLVWSALLLSRALPDVRSRALRLATAAYLALMLAYGFGNVANDFWIEQVVRRGWTHWQIPNVLEPRPTAAWGVILAAAIAGFLVLASWADPDRERLVP
jgi:hypothetical protein